MDIESIKELSPPVLLLLALNVVGWVAKQSAMENKYIPCLLILLGAVSYPFIYEYQDMLLNVRNQLAVAILQGICIGGAAVGVHQAAGIFRKETPAIPATLTPQPVDPPKP